MRRLTSSRPVFGATAILAGAVALGLFVSAGRATAAPAGGGTETVPEMPETVYMTEEQALRESFPEAARFDVDVRPLAAADRARLEKELGGPVADDTLSVHRAWSGSGELQGYGVVSEEIGKYRPITFLVAVTPAIEVARVSVLVYRESHGGDVRRPRFLNQYKGKDYADPIRINRDIINISGATLSVRSLNFGVKKVLGILKAFYPPAETPGGRP